MNINYKLDKIHGKYITANEAIKLGIDEKLILNDLPISKTLNLNKVRIPEQLVIEYLCK